MIRIGPAGSGITNKEGLEYIHKLGLNAMEIEFTYQVFLNEKLAQEIGELAKKLDIALSCHGSYYINLASKEKAKIEASKNRILEAVKIAHFLGATHVVFHSGYYQDIEPKIVYDTVKKNILEMQEKMKARGWKPKLAPETTGKASQFGTVDELLKLKRETRCEFCVDFAHLYARNAGVIDYKEVFDKLKEQKHIHSHFSGITYTKKGERSHIPTSEAFLKPLLKEVKKRKPDITIINESPQPVKDSVKTLMLLKTI